MRLKAKRQNYTYFEGDVEEDSDEISGLEEETLNILNMNNKLLFKVEKKIDKLEKRLNNVPTKEDKIRFQRIYLTKDENLTIVFTVICKTHGFKSKNEWNFRKDIDYNDQLLYQSNVSYLLKSNKIMDYINRDIMKRICIEASCCSICCLTIARLEHSFGHFRLFKQECRCML
ncbi:unnamed protein product [Moneuplotes crassus]|uniref:Uncharacterized protein n=1 Tax=Euplotes crassus TaxID=5936 RepID=A0AAD1XRK0_EUPCR|nr:unnamed protein product [Moneuplotes crassus]